jgi:beta-mannosidase
MHSLIQVAWFNWGWQKSLGYSAADSAKIRQDYEKLFHHNIDTLMCPIFLRTGKKYFKWQRF